MPEISYPFSTSQVRAAEWQDLVSPNSVDGVLLDSDGEGASGLKVSAVSGALTLTVQPGRAVIRGFAYRLTDPLTLTIPANNDPSQQRFDRVVLRLERDLERISVKILAGTPGNYYIPPQPANGAANVWEIPLAQYTVASAGGGVASVTLERTLIGNGLPHVESPSQFRQRGRLFIDRTRANSLDRPLLMTIDSVAAPPFNASAAVVADTGPIRQYTPTITTNPGASGITGTGRWRMLARDVIHVNCILTASKAFSGTASFWLPAYALFGPQVLYGYIKSSSGSSTARSVIADIGGSAGASITADLRQLVDVNGNDYTGALTLAAGQVIVIQGTYIVDPQYLFTALTA